MASARDSCRLVSQYYCGLRAGCGFVLSAASASGSIHRHARHSWATGCSRGAAGGGGGSPLSSQLACARVLTFCQPLLAPAASCLAARACVGGGEAAVPKGVCGWRGLSGAGGGACARAACSEEGRAARVCQPRARTCLLLAAGAQAPGRCAACAAPARLDPGRIDERSAPRASRCATSTPRATPSAARRG